MVTLEITRGDGVTGIARTCRVCFLRSDRLPTIVRLNWSVIGASVRGSAAKNTFMPPLIWMDSPPAEKEILIQKRAETSEMKRRTKHARLNKKIHRVAEEVRVHFS